MSTVSSLDYYSEFTKGYEHLQDVINKMNTDENFQPNYNDLLNLINNLLILSDKPEVREKIENIKEIRESLEKLKKQVQLYMEIKGKISLLEDVLQKLGGTPSKEQVSKALSLLEQVKEYVDPETYSSLKQSLEDYLKAMSEAEEKWKEYAGKVSELRQLLDKIDAELKLLDKKTSNDEIPGKQQLETAINDIDKALAIIKDLPENEDLSKIRDELEQTKETLNTLLNITGKIDEINNLLSSLGEAEDYDTIINTVGEIKARLSELEDMGAEVDPRTYDSLNKIQEYAKLMKEKHGVLEEFAETLDKINEKINILETKSKELTPGQTITLYGQLLGLVNKALSLEDELKPLENYIENLGDIFNSLKEMKENIIVTSRALVKYTELTRILDKLAEASDPATILDLVRKAEPYLSDNDLKTVMSEEDLSNIARYLATIKDIMTTMVEAEQLVEKGKLQEAYNMIKAKLDEYKKKPEKDTTGLVGELERIAKQLKGIILVQDKLNKLGEAKNIEEIFNIVKGAIDIAEKTPDFPEDAFLNLLSLKDAVEKYQALTKLILEEGNLDKAIEYIKQYKETLSYIIDVDTVLKQLEQTRNEIARVEQVLSEINSYAKKGDYERALSLLDKNHDLLSKYAEDIDKLRKQLQFNYELARSKTIDDILSLEKEYKDIIESDPKLKQYFQNLHETKNVFNTVNTLTSQGKIKQAIELLESKADLLKETMGAENYFTLMRNMYAQWQGWLQAWRYTSEMIATVNEFVNNVNKAIEEYNRITESNASDEQVLNAMNNILLEIRNAKQVLDRLPEDIRNDEDIKKIYDYLNATAEKVRKTREFMMTLKQFKDILQKFMENPSESTYTAVREFYFQHLLPVAKEAGLEKVVTSGKIAEAMKLASSYWKYILSMQKLKTSLQELSSPSALTREQGSKDFVSAWSQLLYSLKELKEMGYGDKVDAVIDSLKKIKKQVVLGGLVDPRLLKTWEDAIGIRVDIDVPWYEQVQAWFRGGQEWYRRNVAEAWNEVASGNLLSIPKFLLFSVLGGGFDLASFVPLINDNIEGMKMMIQSIWDANTRAVVGEYLSQPENLSIMISSIGLGLLMGKLLQKVISPKIRLIANSIIGNIDDALIDLVKLGKTRLGATVFYHIHNGVAELKPRFITSKIVRDVIAEAFPDEIKHMDELGARRIVKNADSLVGTFEKKIYDDVRAEIKGRIKSKLNYYLEPMREARVTENLKLIDVIRNLRTRFGSIAEKVSVKLKGFKTHINNIIHNLASKIDLGLEHIAKKLNIKPRISLEKFLKEWRLETLEARLKGQALYMRKGFESSKIMPTSYIRFLNKSLDKLKPKPETLIKFTLTRYKIPSGFLGEFDDVVSMLRKYGLNDLANSLVKLKETLMVKGSVDLATATQVIKALDEAKKKAGLSPGLITKMKNLIKSLPDILRKKSDKLIAKQFVDEIVGKLDEIKKMTVEGGRTRGFLVAKVSENGGQLILSPEEAYKLMKDWGSMKTRIINLFGERWKAKVYGVLEKGEAKRVFELRRGNDFIRIELEVKPIGKKQTMVMANVYVDPQTNPRAHIQLFRQLEENPLDILRRIDPSIDSVPIIRSGASIINNQIASAISSILSSTLGLGGLSGVGGYSKIKDIVSDLRSLGAINTANILANAEKITVDKLAKALKTDLYEILRVNPLKIGKLIEKIKEDASYSPEIYEKMETAVKKALKDLEPEIIENINTTILNKYFKKLNEKIRKTLREPPDSLTYYVPPEFRDKIIGYIPVKPKPIIIVDANIGELKKYFKNWEPRKIRLHTPYINFKIDGFDTGNVIITPDFIDKIPIIKPDNIRKLLYNGTIRLSGMEINLNFQPTNIKPSVDELEASLEKLSPNLDQELDTSLDQLQLKIHETIPPPPPPPPDTTSTPSPTPKPVPKPFGGTFLPFFGFGGGGGGGSSSKRTVKEKIVI